MKKVVFINNTRYLGLLYVTFLLIFFLGVDNGIAETRGVTNSEIRIGIVPDLTGPSADGVRKSIWALQRYFHEVNRAGGVHGRQITLYIQDGLMKKALMRKTW